MWWVGVERELIRYPVWIRYCAIVVSGLRLALTQRGLLKTQLMWYLKTDANVSPAGGTAPCGLPSSPSPFPLAPRPEASSPFLSPLHISKIPAHRSAFFTGLTTFFFCTSPPFLWGFHSFFVLTQTFTHRSRGMAGMCPFLQHHVVVAHTAATAGPEERGCFCRAHGWTDG